MTVIKRLFVTSIVIVLLSACGETVEVLPNPVPILDEVEVEYSFLWRNEFGKGMGEQLIEINPQYAYDKVFVADVSGTVLALDPETGETLWRSQTENPIASGVSVANRIVVVGTREGEVVAFDVDDGEKLWTALTSSEVIAPAAIGEGTVVINTVDGKILALDAENGERKWFYDRNLPLLTLRGTSTPTIASGAAISGFANGKVGVFLLANGRLAWERQVTAPSGRSDLARLVDVDSQPVVFGPTLYVSSFNGNLVALELRSGEPLWSRELSSFDDMTVDNQTLLVTHDNGHLSSLNRNNGSLLWTQKALFYRKATSAAAFDDHIVVGDMDGLLHMLNKEEGKLIGQLNVNNHVNISDCYDSDIINCRLHNDKAFGIASKPLVVDDKLIVHTRNGHLIAYTVTSEE